MAGSSIFSLETLQSLQSCRTPDEMQAVASHYTNQIGLDGFAYHVYGPHLGFHKLDTWPAEWSERYHSQNYGDIDPTVSKVLQETRPFSWSEVYEGHSPGTLQSRLFDEAREFGLKEGAEFPIHGPNATVATFSVFSSGSGQLFYEIWSWNKRDLQLLAHYFHYAFLDHISAGTAKKEPILSARERECLTWRARDKSAWETSRILGISEHTVRSHLTSAARKLDVGSVQQAMVASLLSKRIIPY